MKKYSARATPNEYVLRRTEINCQVLWLPLIMLGKLVEEIVNIIHQFAQKEVALFDTIS